MNTTRSQITLVKHLVWLAALGLLSACGGSSGDAGASGLPEGVSNQAPIFSGSPQGQVKVMVGDEFVVDANASDPDGDPLTFGIRNKPRWAQFDSESGRLRGRPVKEDTGRYDNVVISVTDGMDTTEGEAFTIIVEDPAVATNTAPVLTGTPATSVYAGSQYSFRPGASDADGDSLVFSVDNLPGWAAFDSSNGTLSGTPGAENVGTYANLRIGASDGIDTTYTQAFSITVMAVQSPPANSAPTLSGTPAASVRVGEAYRFQPTASDADGDALSFSVQNLPSWAAFDAGTGAISGNPGDGDVGSYGSIRISVSDGTVTTNGQAFSIEVTQVSLGQATLSWSAPTENMDGSALTDLAGYKLYYGTSEGNYTETITVDNPGILTYVVDNLTPRTYYFVATAYNASGVESPFSGVAVKVVN